MLSDAEQRRLTEIESQLRTDDPAFVRRFLEARQHRRPGPGWRAVLALLGVGVAVAVAGFGLVLGNAVAAVVGLAAIGAGTTMWIHGRRRS